MRSELGEHGAILIGVDRVKDPAIIEAAYNDAAGVTAEFTLNMLARFNRELGADFDLSGFRHRAQYNGMAERIETFIDSVREQDVHIAGHTFHFAPGDSILVEFSCKYSPSRSRAWPRAPACISIKAGPTRKACSACTASIPTTRDPLINPG